MHGDRPRAEVHADGDPRDVHRHRLGDHHERRRPHLPGRDRRLLGTADGRGTPTAPPSAPTPPAPSTDGGAGAVEDGTPRSVETRVTEDGSGVEVEGDGYMLRATSSDRDGQPVGGAETSALPLRTGGIASLDATGFRAGSEIRAWLFSDPQLLGTFEVDGAGTLVEASSRIPSDISACAHTLVLEGTRADGVDVLVSMPTWVQADPYPFPDASHASVHGPAIGCVASLGIAHGYGDGTYRTATPITRGEMAAFLDRALSLEPGGAVPYPDVAGLFSDAIAAVTSAGIATGFEDATYRPDAPLTRAEMAAFLARAARLTVDPAAEAPYGDVDGGVHGPAIAAVTAAGIADGFADGTFRGSDAVTRGQMASFVVRLRTFLELPN